MKKIDAKMLQASKVRFSSLEPVKTAVQLDEAHSLMLSTICTRYDITPEEFIEQTVRGVYLTIIPNYLKKEKVAENG